MKRHRHTPSRCGGVGHTSIVTRVERQMELSLGERAQVGAQRRRRPDRAEEPTHRAVTGRVEIVVDTVRASEHPVDDAGAFTTRFGESALKRARAAGRAVPRGLGQ